jgi:hypothetical protein
MVKLVLCSNSTLGLAEWQIVTNTEFRLQLLARDATTWFRLIQFVVEGF